VTPGTPAVDHPATFTIDRSNSQHVIYRSIDNQVHELTWTSACSSWYRWRSANRRFTTQRLLAASPTAPGG
jgi:hypothetical protein